MIEKRQFHRVQLSSKAILSRNDNIYQGQLQNISMTGALIRFEHGTLLPQGREYELTVIVDGEDAPLQFNAVVVCFSFALAGIKIVSFKADSGTRLAKLIEWFSSEPDIELAERAKIQRLFADYYRYE
jgi:hypothetical protein